MLEAIPVFPLTGYPAVDIFWPITKDGDPAFLSAGLATDTFRGRKTRIIRVKASPLFRHLLHLFVEMCRAAAPGCVLRMNFCYLSLPLPLRGRWGNKS
jgi:hypothetical protein